MTDDVQAKLDDFAHQLAALNAKFEALQHEVAPRPTEAPPVPERQPVPAWLQRLDDLFASGAHEEALHMLEWNLSQRLDSYSPSQLEELLAYLRRTSTPDSRRRDDLLSVIVQELSARRAPKPATPATPRVAPEPAPVPAPPKPRAPRRELPKIEIDLLGPRALAIAGGIVTLLGIVFFFVLAVNHGWIGPRTRVSLGGFAAALVFGAGLELKRRYGKTFSTLAAVGAGIGGGYATLLSAAALYDMLSSWTALVAAGGIAAVGLATSLVWRSQIVGGIGLLGALLVPAVIEAQQGGTSPLATSFVAIVFAVLAGVCIWLRWRVLLVAGALGSVPQLLALTFATRYEHQSPAGVLALVAIFFLLYAATGVVLQLRVSSTRVDTLATPFILGAGLVAGGSLAWLLATNEQRGVALFILAGAYVLPGAFFFMRPRTRDLSAILTFATFTLMAIGFSLLLHGDALVYAWAAEAAGLAWLARTVREIRFQLWSVVYLVLSLIHVLAIDATPRQLFTATLHPAAGALAAVAFALAAAVFAFYARPWSEDELPGSERVVDEIYETFAETHGSLRHGAAWLALMLATYAGSLGAIALFTQFDWAWVAVCGCWLGVGLGALVLAVLRVPTAERGALVWIVVSAATLAGRAALLTPDPRYWSLLVVASGLFAASVVYQLVPRAAEPRQMDASAGLAAAAVLLGAIATHGLLSGQSLAYVWAGEAAVLVWLAARLSAPHLRAVALAPLALAAVHSLAVDARPGQLLELSAHPAGGALTALATGIVAAVFTVPLPTRRKAPGYALLGPAIAAFAAAAVPLNRGLRWLAAAFATYSLSLAVMAAMGNFAWATVTIAAIWMAIGLAALAAGLRRDEQHLRVGALIWLGTAGSVALEQALRLLHGNPHSFAFVAVGIAGLAASMAYGLERRARLQQPNVVFAAGALLALTFFSHAIVHVLDDRWRGAALLGLAALYALLSAALFRRGARNQSTLYWGVAIGVAAVADVLILHGTYAVLAWAALGVAVAWLGRHVREPRLYFGAAVLVALAVVRAFAVQAPPTHLFTTWPNPAYGTASIFAAALAVAAVAYFTLPYLSRLRVFRTAPWWLSGGLAVYGLSLLILELVERISSAGAHTEFQRGQTAVTAFWGLLAFALLYAGLRRRQRMFRVAGLAFFPICLAKIFFFDLPSLSSITRALSFLAVGAVLLLGGFFYQRFLSEREEPPPASTPS